MSRILYVVTGAGFGGAPRHVLQLMSFMLKQGHQVGLVAAPEPRLMKEAQHLGVTYFPNPFFVRPFRPWQDVRAVLPVFHAVRAFHPDLLHAHSTKAGLLTRLVGFLTRIPVIFTAHGWIFSEEAPLWKRRLFVLLETWAAKATTAIICVSYYDYDLALHYGVAPSEKLTVIHNGVDPKVFQNRDPGAVRAALQIQDSPVLTMVGRLAPPKDPFTLLEAWALLDEKPFLLLVGAGELLDPIGSYLENRPGRERVRLLGERHDIESILMATDIFVLSSRKEGLPYTIIEAMMAGLPVVASQVGGLPELVDEGITGYLVPAREPVALANAIQRLLKDKVLRQRMGAQGRTKALQAFTLDQMLTKTQRIYEEVLA